jgi:hypothetical protein
MEIGVHLPQLALAGGALSSGRLQAAAQAARRLGTAGRRAGQVRKGTFNAPCNAPRQLMCLETAQN